MQPSVLGRPFCSDIRALFHTAVSTAARCCTPSQACIESSLKVVSVLLQNGANVNATDNDWWTPLHAAAACDHWRIVSVLLQNGADVSMVNADGDLAVDLAEDGKTKQGLEAEMARQGQCSDRQIFRLH